ncbi:MAG: DUF839 domain-containing protein, partial [Planctomycetales bacterium]
ILTNNSQRNAEQVYAANPRSNNQEGRIMELIPPAAGSSVDHAVPEFRWDVFVRGGDPGKPEVAASYHPDVSDDGWFSCPDNGAFDSEGRLWLTTDCDHRLTGFGTGIYAMDTEGSGRALPKLFFRGPRGSEVTGICLAPDGETMFVAVQHPGQEGSSHFEKPSTRWPDFDPTMPPRPSVVAVTRRKGGVIGQ